MLSAGRVAEVLGAGVFPPVRFCSATQIVGKAWWLARHERVKVHCIKEMNTRSLRDFGQANTI